MNPDESGFVIGVDGPEREGGDDQGRLGWRTVWTALLRQPGGGPGSGAAADAAGPGSSSNGADSRHATPTVRFRLRLQSRFQPHYQTRSGRPGRESSFARRTRRDCASAVSPRNTPEPARPVAERGSADDSTAPAAPSTSRASSLPPIELPDAGRDPSLTGRSPIPLTLESIPDEPPAELGSERLPADRSAAPRPPRAS